MPRLCIVRLVVAVAAFLTATETAFAQEGRVTISLNSATERITVVEPVLDPTAFPALYQWNCLYESGRVETIAFGGRWRTFYDLRAAADDGCVSVVVYRRIAGGGTHGSNTVRIAGIREEGDPPWVTVRIGHTGDGYTEGDVYGFTVIYTDLIGRTVTIDAAREKEKFNRIFNFALWYKTGVSYETGEPQPPYYDGDFSPNPDPPFGPLGLSPIDEMRDIECPGTADECENSTPSIRTFPATYTLSHSHHQHSNDRPFGYPQTLYLDHFAVVLAPKYGSGNLYSGYLFRNDRPEISAQLTLTRTDGNPLPRPNANPFRSTLSFADNIEFSVQHIVDGIGPDRNGDEVLSELGRALPRGVRDIQIYWQCVQGTIPDGNGQAADDWVNIRDAGDKSATYTPQLSHNERCGRQNYPQLRALIVVTDQWGLRDTYTTERVAFNHRQFTGKAEITYSELRVGATLTLETDNIRDFNGGSVTPTRYRWGKNGNVGNLIGSSRTYVIQEDDFAGSISLIVGQVDYRDNQQIRDSSSAFLQVRTVGVTPLSLTILGPDIYAPGATISLTSEDYAENEVIETQWTVRDLADELHGIILDDLFYKGAEDHQILHWEQSGQTVYVSVDYRPQGFSRPQTLTLNLPPKVAQLHKSEVQYGSDNVATLSVGFDEPLGGAAYYEWRCLDSAGMPTTISPLITQSPTIAEDDPLLRDRYEHGDDCVYFQMRGLRLSDSGEGIPDERYQSPSVNVQELLSPAPPPDADALLEVRYTGECVNGLESEGVCGGGYRTGDIFTVAVTAEIRDALGRYLTTDEFESPVWESAAKGNGNDAASPQSLGQTDDRRFTLNVGDFPVDSDDGRVRFLRASVASGIPVDAGAGLFWRAFYKVDERTQNSIVIDGEPMFAADETYTANTGNLEDKNGIGDFTYQWSRSLDDGVNYDEISGQTLSVYTLDENDFTGADENIPGRLRVVAVHTDAEGFRFTLTAFLIEDKPTRGSVVIEDGANLFAAGETYTANTVNLTDANGIGDFTYQWLRSLDDGVSYAPISGETNAVYTFNANHFAGADANIPLRLRVEVVHTDLDDYESVHSAFVIQDTPTRGNVVIEGEHLFAAGEEYTANTDGLTDGNGIGDFTYQWSRSLDDGVSYAPISGETNRAYTFNANHFTGADENIPLRLRVEVVHTDLDGYESAHSAISIQDTPTQGSVVIEGEHLFATGETYTASISITDGNGIGGFTYQWYVSTDGGTIYNGLPDATGATYTLSADDIAILNPNIPARLGVAVVHTDLDDYRATLTAILLQDTPGTGELTISGLSSFAAGEEYAADTSDIGPNDANGEGGYVYSWYASINGNPYNEIVAPSADASAYTLVLSDFTGANANPPPRLLLSVVHTDAAGFPQEYLATIIHLDVLATGTLGISIRDGVIREGAVVELDTSALGDENGGGVALYSWHLNGGAIAGATESTYTLSSSDVPEIRGGGLHSEVLYRDDFGAETRFSITLSGVSDSLGAGAARIGGGDSFTADSFAADKVYTAITADIGANDANGEGSYVRSWFASIDGANYDSVGEANSETYTLALSDFAGASPSSPVHLLLSVVHTDGAGFTQTYLATLIHSDTATDGTALGIEIRGGVIRENAVVELNTAGVSDINGGGVASVSWHLNNGAAIAGATENTYTLSLSDLPEIRNAALHAEVLYRDDFGAETRFSITLFGGRNNVVAPPDSRGTGNAEIRGTVSFAADAEYEADTSEIGANDANGEGGYVYSWFASIDGGAKYTVIVSPSADASMYTLSLSDFTKARANPPPRLLLSVVHTDLAGFAQTYLATIIHLDVLATGTLGISVRDGVIREGAVVELDTSALGDENGGGVASYSWHLANGAAIVGATESTYTLSSSDVPEIMNSALHAEVLYRDDFDAETRFSITLFGAGDDVLTPPDSPGTGTLGIEGTVSFAAEREYRADTSDIGANDANEEGSYVYSWFASIDGGANYGSVGEMNSDTYTLLLSDFTNARANPPPRILLVVVHTDKAGTAQEYRATLMHSDASANGVLEVNPAGFMAGDAIVADASGISDANGALTFSYQWQRGDKDLPQSFVDIADATGASYTIYADDYAPDAADSLRLIVTAEDPFGGESVITGTIVAINHNPDGNLSLNLIDGQFRTGATVTLSTGGVSDMNGGVFESYYWLVNNTVLADEKNDFLVIGAEHLRDIAGGGLRAEAEWRDGLGFTTRFSVRLGESGMVAPPPDAEEIAGWSVVVEVGEVVFTTVNIARAILRGAESEDVYEFRVRWETGVGESFGNARNVLSTRVLGVGDSVYGLNAGHFNPQDHLRAVAELVLYNGAVVTLTSSPVRINYPTTGEVRIVASGAPVPGVMLRADISGVSDANNGTLAVGVVSGTEKWSYSDAPVASGRSYVLTEESVHAGKVFYEATFVDLAGFETVIRAEADVGEVSEEKAEAVLGAINAVAAEGLWHALEGHLDNGAGIRANGAPLNDPSQIAAALSRRAEDSVHSDSPFALDSFALKQTGNGDDGREWSWWAHGSRSKLEGDPLIDGDRVKYRGDYSAFYAGMDRQISDTMRAGLAFGADATDLDVEWQQGVSGGVRQNIRSLIPYAQFRPDKWTEFRILAGYGAGKVVLAEHDNAATARARRTILGIRASRRRDLPGNFDITYSGGFDNVRLRTGMINLSGLRNDLDARTNERHFRLKGGHRQPLPENGVLRKALSIRWRSQSGDGGADSVFDLGAGFDAELPEYALSFGADGERQLTESTHNRRRLGAYISYGTGRFAHLWETRYDGETSLPSYRWKINAVSEWGISELMSGVYAEQAGGEAELKFGWESTLQF